MFFTLCQERFFNISYFNIVMEEIVTDFRGRKHHMKIAHAGHAELRVKDFEASKRFFTETMGLFISYEDNDRAYLRAWQDFEHHSLILTKGETSALVHLGWR